MPMFLSDPMPAVHCGERHIPAVLLTDCSGSMDGAPINELNQGLIDFGHALNADSLARGRAEVCVIKFNSEVSTEVGFRPAAEYEAPRLEASGCTCLNGAILAGLKAIQERKDLYRSQGITWYRPWLFVLTDGAPTDTEQEAAAKAELRAAIEGKKVVYMPMAIGPHADKRKLQEYYPENFPNKFVLSASATDFRDGFVWLGNSMGVVSHSNPAQQEQVTLPPVPDTIAVGI